VKSIRLNCPAIYFLVTTISFCILNIQASYGAVSEEPVKKISGNNVSLNQINDTPRFSMYKRNFLLWSIPADRKDERGLQLRFSAQYRFLECTNELNNGISQGTCAIFDWKPLTDFVGRLNLSLSYTTDFDFYIISEGNQELKRNSRPVRNRMTSPAFHFNWISDKPLRASGMQYRSLTFSVVHHSNGQDIEFESMFSEDTTDADIRDTVAELERTNPAWTDGISRGWNYIELLSRVDTGINIPNCTSEFYCVSLLAGIRHDIFTDPVNRIWWEPGNDAEYLDYNRFSLQIIDEWGRSRAPDPQFFSTGKKRFALELKCGSGGCSSNASLRTDVYLGEGNFQLPLMVYGHFGRNEHLYNYHQKANMIGVGFEFSQ